MQEMYAFAMAVWTSGLKSVDLYGHLVAQPPFDETYELTAGRPFYILHYTYGLDFNTTTGKRWKEQRMDNNRDDKEKERKTLPRFVWGGRLLTRNLAGYCGVAGR